MGLFQSLLPKRGGKTRPWTEFHFMVQKRPVPGSGGPSLAKKPHLESGNEAHPSDKTSAGGNVSTSSTDTRRRLALLMFHGPQIPHHLHLQFLGWYAFHIF